MNFSILCDFDGTIALADTTDLLLEYYADSRWHEIEVEWEAGEIGSAECMQRQIELIDASPEQIEKLLQTVKIDAHFPAFIKFCDSNSLPFKIVSDGIDSVIHNILKNNGIDGLEVIANRLTSLGNRKYRLDPAYTGNDCQVKSGVCKCSILEATKQQDTKIIFIGDGRSDFCVASEADIVLATGKLKKFCEKQKIQYFGYDNFADVKNIVASLIKA